MKIKPLKVMTYLFLSLAFSILPLANASAYEPPIDGYITSNPGISSIDFFSETNDVGVRKINDNYYKIIPGSYSSTALTDLKLVYARPLGDSQIGQIFHVQYVIFQPISQGSSNAQGSSVTPVCPATRQGYNIYDCQINKLGSDWQLNYLNYPSGSQGSAYLEEWTALAGSPAWSVDIWGVYTSQMYYNYWLSQNVWLRSNGWLGDIGLLINTIDTYKLDATNREIVDAIEELKEALENSSDAGQVLEDHRNEDRQDMEDAQGDAEDAGQDAGQEVTEETGDMINLVGGIIGAITDTNATNCNVTANWGNLNLGQLNLCSAPQEIRAVLQTVLGVIGVIVVLNTVHYLVDTVYNMTKEVQDT